MAPPMQSKPLSHVRILEIGGYISVPYGTSILCALGAEVVKVEKPALGEDFRRGENERGKFFIQYNAGKRSISVDLKQADGVELVKQLVPNFDVLVENLRPGKLAALGLGPEDCTALRPDLIYMSVTGFGSGGPLAQRPAYDTIGQAFGAYNTIFSDAGQPQLVGSCIADLATGLSTAMGILAALVGRVDRSGHQRLETSIMEAVSLLSIDAITEYFANDHESPSRQTRHPQAQNFVLKTASGDSIAVHLSNSEKFWKRLADVIGRSDLTTDPRFRTYSDREEHYFQLAAILNETTANRPSTEWEKLLTDADVPFAPVHKVEDYLHHEQTEWLRLMRPENEGLGIVQPPWRFGGERPTRADRAPRVGQDTRDVAQEVCDEARIEQLLERGVLYADE